MRNISKMEEFIMITKEALAAAKASYGYTDSQVRAEKVNEMLVSF